MAVLRLLPARVWRDDLGGYAACLLVGATLSWLCQTYPTRLPAWAPTAFDWPVFLSCAVAIWCYGRGLARTSGAARPRRWRQACFAVGLVSIYAVLQTHFLYVSQHMFFLNRVQHLVMHHVGPFLVALSCPGRMLDLGAPAPLRRIARDRRLRGMIRAVQHPIPAGILFVGLIWFWLIPAIHFRAMIAPSLYAVMNWSMVVDGLLFWFLVLDPRPKPLAPLSYPMRLLLVFCVQLPQVALGAWIAFVGRNLYPYYDLCGRLLPSIDAQLDQQIGGMIVCFGGGMMSAAAALIVLDAMWRDEMRQHELAAASMEQL